MSGAVAAHAAYNGSGTQGLAVTNKITGNEGDVMSVFWNKNDTTRQLLHGSTFVEIPSSSGSGSNAITKANIQVFEVNNDIDCLGNLVLKVTIAGALAPYVDNAAFSAVEAFSAISIIDRIEFQVGTQTWQTIEKGDLIALASTELSESAHTEYAFQASGGLTTDMAPNTLASAAANKFATRKEVFYGIPTAGGLTAYIPLKMLTKTLTTQLESFSDKMEGGYLMAAAPNQQVKIKVFTAAASANITNNTAIVSGSTLPSTFFSNDKFASATINLSLFAQQHVMCNAERDQMLSLQNVLPRRVKMTQNVLSTLTAANTFNIVLDSFSLYASHLLITIPATVITSDILTNISSTVELLLNSSSFSGALPFGLLNELPASVGLYSNAYVAKGIAQDPYNVFVFPLASRAYGGSGVPLNRFDNISLRLKLSANATAGSIFITCVGETTALYKGGASSLAMY